MNPNAPPLPLKQVMNFSIYMNNAPDTFSSLVILAPILNQSLLNHLWSHLSLITLGVSRSILPSIGGFVSIKGRVYNFFTNDTKKAEVASLAMTWASVRALIMVHNSSCLSCFKLRENYSSYCISVCDHEEDW